ncbi:MAG: hypothetical protein HY314_02895 [Acidobacteria bacterium]|nr:hypothetical protein [Acidobacteriota bacterium]
MSKRIKPTLKLLAVVFAASMLYLPLTDWLLGATVLSEGVAADSGAQAQNPYNPCSKKTGAQNPCNPCGKKAQNPCNPCSGKMKATGKVYQDAATYRSWAKLIEPKLSQAHSDKYVITVESVQSLRNKATLKEPAVEERLLQPLPPTRSSSSTLFSCIRRSDVRSVV